MLIRKKMPDLIVKNPLGSKAIITTKFNYFKFFKNTFLFLFISTLLVCLYFTYLYINIILDENKILQDQLQSNVVEEPSQQNNMLMNAFSKIIIQEGKVSKEIADQYVKWIFEYSYKDKVDPLLVLSVISVESGFNYQAQSNSNALGLMQVIYYWHKDKVKSSAELFDPQTNIKTGVRILRDYLALSKNSQTEALLRYNGSLGQSPIYSIKVLQTKKKFYFKILKDLANN